MLYFTDCRAIRRMIALPATSPHFKNREIEAPSNQFRLFTAIELVRLAMQLQIVPDLFDEDSVSFYEIWRRPIEPRLLSYAPDNPRDPAKDASVEHVSLHQDLMALLPRLAAHNVTIGMQAVGPTIWWMTFGRMLLEELATGSPRNLRDEYAIVCLLTDVSELIDELSREFGIEPIPIGTMPTRTPGSSWKDSQK